MRFVEAKRPLGPMSLTLLGPILRPKRPLLGPSWGSELGSQRLKRCAFRVSEMLMFAFGGRLKEEVKPTKTEEPQEEANDAQQLAQRGSTSIIGPRNSGLDFLGGG